jgi:hypothetical protein
MFLFKYGIDIKSIELIAYMRNIILLFGNFFSFSSTGFFSKHESVFFVDILYFIFLFSSNPSLVYRFMMHFYNKNKELDNDLTYFFLFRIEI